MLTMTKFKTFLNIQKLERTLTNLIITYMSFINKSIQNHSFYLRINSDSTRIQHNV